VIPGGFAYVAVLAAARIRAKVATNLQRRGLT